MIRITYTTANHAFTAYFKTLSPNLMVASVVSFTNNTNEIFHSDNDNDLKAQVEAYITVTDGAIKYKSNPYTVPTK